MSFNAAFCLIVLSAIVSNTLSFEMCTSSDPTTVISGDCSSTTPTACGQFGQKPLYYYYVNSTKQCREINNGFQVPVSLRFSNEEVCKACLSAKNCKKDCSSSHSVKVCDAAGKVYSNVCEFDNAKCDNTALEKKDCPCEKDCTEESNPVCGSDRVTYSNICKLENAKCKNSALTKKTDGECPCEKDCGEIAEPVCGSDKTTYNNICELENAKCKNSALTKVSSGKCPKKCPPKPKCEGFCTKIYRPVCGSDGKTYSSPCRLRYKACKKPSLRLRQVRSGRCKRRCVLRRCARILRPVCGTDGKTYSNRCMLLNAKCKNRRLRVKRRGRCCDRPCPKNYAPVCGSDGETYSNKCLFRIAVCKNKRLSLASSGECQPEYDYDYYDYYEPYYTTHYWFH